MLEMPYTCSFAVRFPLLIFFISPSLLLARFSFSPAPIVFALPAIALRSKADAYAFAPAFPALIPPTRGGGGVVRWVNQPAQPNHRPPAPGNRREQVKNPPHPTQAAAVPPARDLISARCDRSRQSDGVPAIDYRWSTPWLN